MNDLTNYLASKCLETSSVELIKQEILRDSSISKSVKKEWISAINMLSMAKNMADICKILSGRM